MGTDEAVGALRAGELVVLPADTVYGLCASAYSSTPTLRAYRLKGRSPDQPSAVIAPDVDALLESLPELRGRSATIARALLPGPYTLVLDNPAHRYRWLCGASPDAIGVRVPVLPHASRPIVERLGLVMATSANLPGRPEPRRADEVAAEIREGCAGVVDGGELPGVSSTVIDFTDPEPKVLREGAGSAAEALRRAADALG
jgi:L-threonylcarbamoyladenylate synthase